MTCKDYFDKFNPGGLRGETNCSFWVKDKKCEKVVCEFTPIFNPSERLRVYWWFSVFSFFSEKGKLYTDGNGEHRYG